MDKILESMVLQAFRFLVSDFGMSQPWIREEGSMLVISYLGENVGFELELDIREEQLYLLVVRLTEGQLPKGYYRENDQIVRIHLEKLLKFQYGIDVIQASQSRISIQQQIERYALLLQQHGDKLMRDSVDLFKHPPL